MIIILRSWMTGIILAEWVIIVSIQNNHTSVLSIFLWINLVKLSWNSDTDIEIRKFSILEVVGSLFVSTEMFLLLLCVMKRQLMCSDGSSLTINFSVGLSSFQESLFLHFFLSFDHACLIKDHLPLKEEQFLWTKIKVSPWSNQNIFRFQIIR